MGNAGRYHKDCKLHCYPNQPSPSQGWGSRQHTDYLDNTADGREHSAASLPKSFHSRSQQHHPAYPAGDCMSNGQQTICSPNSNTDATTGACTAGTSYRSHSSAAVSKSTPDTASSPKPDTASAYPSMPTSVCCSSSISHSAAATCGGPPCSRVSAPAYSSSTSHNPTTSTPRSASPGTPATGHRASSPSDHAGVASQPRWSNSFRCYSTTEHKQSKCCNPAAGQCLPYAASCEGGNNQSNTMSAFCNHPGTQSGCNFCSESPSWHGACCYPYCFHSDTHDQHLGVCTILAKCRGKAAGAHSSSPCSASSEPSSAGHPDIIFSTSSYNPADYHCEWTGVCLAACEDF